MHKVLQIAAAAVLGISAAATAQIQSSATKAASSLLQRRSQSESVSTDVTAGNVVVEDAIVDAVTVNTISVADSLLTDSAAVANAGIVEIAPIPEYYLLPAVFDTYRFLDPDTLPVGVKGVHGAEWLDRTNYIYSAMDRAKQAYMISSPTTVRYNQRWLPEPPKKFEAVIDPSTQKIDIREVKVDPNAGKNIVAPEIDRRNWIHAFTGNLQFSQAFISPNWYQGGNNNLNMIAQAVWNVKLNQAYHPKLLFESTVQYKLGMNNAPDDEMHDYNISEDLFQWNMTAGYKANKRWYYSMNTQFKTQILNNYKPNSNTLKAAFMSPGELNIGLGMTYNYANKNKTFTFDASISPLSYNLKTCTRGRMKETSFGIEEGRKTVSEYGSNAEGKLTWQILENISLRSRLFVFSDYDYIQSDWENTIQFTVNRFLSTQIYVHMRYDSTSPVIEDTDWHKFQLKEILSFGFTYKFGN